MIIQTRKSEVHLIANAIPIRVMKSLKTLRATHDFLCSAEAEDTHNNRSKLSPH